MNLDHVSAYEPIGAPVVTPGCTHHLDLLTEVFKPIWHLYAGGRRLHVNCATVEKKTRWRVSFAAKMLEFVGERPVRMGAGYQKRFGRSDYGPGRGEARAANGLHAHGIGCTDQASRR